MKDQPTQDRRTFLKQSAAAIAIPLFIPARALGRDGAVAPSNRVTFATIGCGAMGEADTSQLFDQRSTQLVAVCDVDQSKRNLFRDNYNARYTHRSATKFAGIDTYHDFRELLAQDTIDAVVITTPEHWHAIPAIQAARAGKDIYCEKPMALTPREGRAMVNAVRENARVFQTGSQQRSSRDFRVAAELVRNGRIGRVHTVYVRVGGPSGDCHLPAEPVPDGLDWDFWIGPAPFHPYNHGIHPGNWRSYRDFAGGGTSDWGAHHFDIVQWALGMDGSGPVEFNPPHGKDHPCLYFRYENGPIVYHVCGPGASDIPWPSPPIGDDNGITFVGDRGWIEVDRSHIRTSPAGLAYGSLRPGEIELFRSPGHHRNWLDCIASRERPVCDVEIGHRSATICRLANVVHWLGRTVRWDPLREQVIGDDEATRMLDRPMRGPWAL